MSIEEKLSKMSSKQLKELCEQLDLPTSSKKAEMNSSIMNAVKELDTYKKEKVERYKRIEKLGSGKEGTTYLVEERDTKIRYAMKVFKAQKSHNRLKTEALMLKRASKVGISPMLVDIDIVSKYIVMELMDGHLIDLITKQKGKLKEKQQERIIEIFEALDKIKIFHGDINMRNYMYKGEQIYIIDFGMSKEIDGKFIAKHNILSPNIELMLIGFILKLKEASCPSSSYKHLLKALPKSIANKYFNFTE